MIRDILSNGALNHFATAGLTVFVLVFVAICAWILTRSKDEVRRWSRLPLRNGTEPDSGDRFDGHDDLFRKCPMHRAEKHIRADRDAVDAFAQLRHHAGAFRTGGEGERRFQLVFTLDDQDVGKIHPCRADLHANMALLDLGRVDVLDFVGLVRAEGLAHDGFHGASP